MFGEDTEPLVVNAADNAGGDDNDAGLVRSGDFFVISVGELFELVCDALFAGFGWDIKLRVKEDIVGDDFDNTT